jgi:hypothetical protein
MDYSLKDLASQYLQYHARLDAQVILSCIYSDGFLIRTDNEEPCIVWLFSNHSILPELNLWEYNE